VFVPCETTTIKQPTNQIKKQNYQPTNQSTPFRKEHNTALKENPSIHQSTDGRQTTPQKQNKTKQNKTKQNKTKQNKLT